MSRYLKVDATRVLSQSEADEYAGVIYFWPICHDDCMDILRNAARLKSLGIPNRNIIRAMNGAIERGRNEEN